jgi:probable phosphoglycerate mutase
MRHGEVADFDDPAQPVAPEDVVLTEAGGGVNGAILSWALAGRGAFLAHLEQSPGCINIVDGGPEFVVRAVNVTTFDPVHLGQRSTTLEDMLEQYRSYRARMEDVSRSRSPRPPG